MYNKECKDMADEEKISEYFKECEGLPAIDIETGLPIMAKGGGYIYEQLPKSPTLTGLALSIGMTSKRELFETANQEGDGKTQAMLKIAIARVEENAERRLLESGVGGAKFFLASNFDGWDKGEENPQMDTEYLRGLSTATLKRYLEKMQ